ncbi:hypothetical protein M7I_7141 [Glarea lozoyensis 74030]|uniref:Uncharacterized protein n=1 Tax=Glarea lozoyensis (strain ATCC 74030 / MF5533) TaxID=1104152 RepID=H0EWH5_GLAL7|nr:hypothetical protein M7I_7141 [Glarea lozoyensis 74030]
MKAASVAVTLAMMMSVTASPLDTAGDLEARVSSNSGVSATSPAIVSSASSASISSPSATAVLPSTSLVQSSATGTVSSSSNASSNTAPAVSSVTSKANVLSSATASSTSGTSDTEDCNSHSIAATIRSFDTFCCDFSQAHVEDENYHTCLLLGSSHRNSSVVTQASSLIYTTPALASSSPSSASISAPAASSTNVSGNSGASTSANTADDYDTPTGYAASMDKNSASPSTTVSAKSAVTAPANPPYGFIGASLCGVHTLPVSVVEGTIATAGVSQTSGSPTISGSPYAPQNSTYPSWAVPHVSSSTPNPITTSSGLVNGVRLSFLIGFFGLAILIRDL